MEHLLFIAIVLALIEWRKVEQNKQFKAIEAQLECGLLSLRSLVDEQKKFMAKEFVLVRAEIGPSIDFLTKAHGDLGMIVKEYELNGIPIHLRRGIPEQQFDAIEGL